MRKRLHRLRSSIFTKLLAITVGMGLVIVMSAAITFFFIVVRPLLGSVASAQQAQMQVLHDRFLMVLLVTLVVVLLVGHAMLRRVLAPVRWLQQGVTSLSEGDLEVVVRHRTNDELGALTLAFNQMVRRVSEMLRARDQLLLDVSHELRSPLTRMKVALALCPPGEHTERLRTNIEEMEHLVSGLLELERLRQGRGVQLRQQDLMEIVRDAVAAFAPLAPGVRLHEAPPSAVLNLDADKVRAVLGNLLDNACKYALPDSDAVRVSVTLQPDKVEVRVTDDGPGIPKDDLNSLFEPFFRVDRSRSKRTGGFGLGLSLCNRIMEAHAGSIRALNNRVRGATFVLEFPRSARAETSVAAR